MGGRIRCHPLNSYKIAPRSTGSRHSRPPRRKSSSAAVLAMSNSVQSKTGFAATLSVAISFWVNMTPPFGEALETILLVEGQSVLRRFIQQLLEDAGFTVIVATSGKEALRLESEFPGTIHLLLADLRMTGISGPSLAIRMKDRRPQLRVMLISSYPGGALLVLNGGWHYIEKPLVPSFLVSKTKDVLRGEIREESADRFETLKVPRRSVGRAPVRFPPNPSGRRRRA